MKILLFAVLPVLIALVLVVIVLGAIVPRATSNDQQFDLSAGEGVSVDLRNATLHFVPSDDADVHVEVSGFSWGGRAPLQTDDSGPLTEISGGCRGGWFMVCRMTLVVEMPADLPLTVEGTNGNITAEDLSGTLELRTTNGSLEVTNSLGELDLRTTNGAITVTDSSSALVESGTTNGRVALEFSRAPRTVEATSTNGAISVRVPDDGEQYNIDADTVNGGVDTDSVPEDTDSARSISARTTNGAVTITTTD
ncbi:putative adhesin [Glaciihabitans tibetensis]|uniref:Putative adhesin n=1 Tax=Glaciihabitans tibetensis TaxID=1266600 RepID=A0A2T0VK98_9MICO|nr:putative adhesin [Glaciihabitans tibetensis]